MPEETILSDEEMSDESPEVAAALSLGEMISEAGTMIQQCKSYTKDVAAIAEKIPEAAGLAKDSAAMCMEAESMLGEISSAETPEDAQGKLDEMGTKLSEIETMFGDSYAMMPQLENGMGAVMPEASPEMEAPEMEDDGGEFGEFADSMG